MAERPARAATPGVLALPAPWIQNPSVGPDEGEAGLALGRGVEDMSWCRREAPSSGFRGADTPWWTRLRIRRCVRRVFPHAPVQHEVMPAAGEELGTADHPFPREACLGERPLLRHVLDIRRRLDSVHVTAVEQVLDKQALSRRAISPAPGSGDQVD